MKFWRRARYYMMGLGIGTLLVFFMFKGKGCSWLPENRVLDEIHLGTILLSDKVKCELICNEISEEDLYEVFAEHRGSVVFSESEPREDPKMYVIETKDEAFKLRLTLKDSVARINALMSANKAVCNCTDVSDSTYTLFNKPVSKLMKELFYVEGKIIKFNKKAKCEMACYNLTNEDINAFIDGKPKWNKARSRPNAKPAIYVFENEINSRPYQLVFEDAGRRTRLIEILSSEQSCDCMPEIN